MSNNELVNPDGSKIARVITWKGKEFPWRMVDQAILSPKIQPHIMTMASLVQVGDQTNVMWLGMLTLARDLYSRQPDGSHEFLDFMQELGLVIIDKDRNKTDICDELLKVFKKA